MKIQNYLLGMCAALGLLLSSCEQDNENAVYGGSTMGVTFGFNSQSVSFPAEGYEGFDVEVMRAQADEAVTIPLSAVMLEQDAEGNTVQTPVPSTIQVPSSVSFAAGEKFTSFHVSVGDIESGITFRLYVTMANEEYAPIDNISSKTISIYRDYTYSSIGIGMYVSSFFQGYGEVEVQKADQITWYKAIAPVEEGYDITFQVADDGRTVTVASQEIVSSYGQYGAVSVAGSGELENGVITVDLEFTVVLDGQVGTFGVFEEQLVLPEAMPTE